MQQNVPLLVLCVTAVKDKTFSVKRGQMIPLILENSYLKIVKHVLNSKKALSLGAKYPI